MNNLLYRAWRFTYPGLDVAQRGGGLLAEQHAIAMVDGDESVRQAILILLSTSPGERVMRPDYGCSLERVMFSTNDDTTAGIAIHYIRQALEKWEPRIDIHRLDAERDNTEHGKLNLIIEYQVRLTGQRDRIELALNLLGEATP